MILWFSFKNSLAVKKGVACQNSQWQKKKKKEGGQEMAAMVYIGCMIAKILIKTIQVNFALKPG